MGNTLTSVVRSITRSEQYNRAEHLAKSATTRLLVVERTPTLLEKNLEKVKEGFRNAIVHSIEKAVTTDFTFFQLFSKNDSRKELQFWDGEARNFAITQIYGLKHKQTLSGNRFRFDFVSNNSILPLLISDDKLVYWTAAQAEMIVETEIDVSRVADSFFTAYSNAEIITDAEMSASLEVQYKDRQMVMVVDEKDRFLGILPRVIAHSKKMLHRGIFIEFVDNSGNMVISKRGPVVSKEPEKLDFAVAGHCDPGDLESPGCTTKDSYVNCAIRETKEETGLLLSPEQLLTKEKVHLITKSGENVFVQIFELKVTENQISSIKKSDEGEILPKHFSQQEISLMAKQGELADWFAEVVQKREAG